ncbi:MAG: AAA family ATPase [Treponema sp.]|jgi:predicted AAA+ superfamily ATPase|nr:AAA family ATPase [Treponema sp.]
MAKNTYFNRKIDSNLLSWMKESDRKPLLLRGARQVGKSSAIRHLAKQFDHFIEINFEQDKDAGDMFARGDLSPDRLCQELAAIYQTPIIPGKTLLFLDEIQSSLPAISSLRFFYERYKDLHVVAAGSLLEFALQDLPSFGVGRLRSMFMYPMNFFEFLNACNHELLLEAILNADCKNPLSDTVHKKTIELLRKFLLLGGMPEVVSNYVNTNDLLSCQQILNDLVISLRADFSKYKEKIPTLQIQTVFDSVAAQMGKKFVFANVSRDYTHRQLKEGLELLKMAGLVIPVIHSAANRIPLGAEIDIKKQKLLLLDTGIFQRLLGLPLTDLLISGDFALVNRGNIAELFTGLEILKSASCYEQKNLYYWHRESKSSNAEVDYAVQIGNDIIPIEVKSSTKGAMQSMRLFLEEKCPPFGIRTSLENFGELPGIKIVPLYAIGTFITQHK